jgi:hypothetical protein
MTYLLKSNDSIATCRKDIDCGKEAVTFPKKRFRFEYTEPGDPCPTTAWGGDASIRHLSSSPVFYHETLMRA